jgi:adenosylmethionine-8-amino-7-oxononanoate aminotransferase
MEAALVTALRARLDGHTAVSEIRGGTGTMAAVALHRDLTAGDPSAPAKVALEARERGVLVRPLGDGVAVSPPLTATEEHFGLAADAILHGLETLLAAASAAPGQ